MWRACILLFLGIAGLTLRADSPTTKPATTPSPSPDPRFMVGELLVRDDFVAGLSLWRTELEKGGTITARGGVLDIDVPGGCTVWLAAPLTGPVLISYEATAVAAGGANDRVSDLNCFWMAQDARNAGDIFGAARSGRFADYDQLRCYYVGLGGNANTTTRFRRYIGEKGNRPLLPEHDLSAKEFLLVPNAPQLIEIVAGGADISYHRDGRRLFAYEDPHPYANGWFGFRTVISHLKIKNFRVHRLVRSGDASTLWSGKAKS